jgi:hypothetical protein
MITLASIDEAGETAKRLGGDSGKALRPLEVHVAPPGVSGDRGQGETRHVLVPVDGGYRIRRERTAEGFDPPLWTAAGWLNRGRRFATREAARLYMASETER